MNFLAHLHLADPTPESLIGNLMADFTRNVDLDDYPLGVAEGIRLHRAIDQFTDDHPDFRKSRRSLSIERRRFAPIMVDVFYDFFLSRHWGRYSDIPLDLFIRETYGTLSENQHLLNDHLREALPVMLEQDWLSSYATVDGIGLTLRRISNRSTRIGAMIGGEEELIEHEASFEEHFLSYYPDLIAFVKERKSIR